MDIDTEKTVGIFASILAAFFGIYRWFKRKSDNMLVQLLEVRDSRMDRLEKRVDETEKQFSVHAKKLTDNSTEIKLVKKDVVYIKDTVDETRQDVKLLLQKSHG